ncbi:hypothetical protein Syn7502_00010 [Synechococcus sp. PCC 7502]|uniref:DUF6930 domain-containing protein n=1 Tax=Synechococcus sp. PCC 7502 TaxID=1173263 RepID=UPI00029F9FCF|nr:hypothetical protein [Synechococcus sp. PCC 7502]AFY72185.1 hypothetical protein Syn7502_00010 [Synechococcus sp. PCC 7502]
MTALKNSTIRRLKQIPQSNSVWEGDRRSLPRIYEQDGSNLIHIADHTQEDKPQYILWVDGTMGVVRSMDIVKPRVGNEAIVRALLQAMERPQSPSKPSRPQKILVRDRSLQFYLRGVLQSLDICVEHIDHLPMIDEIFENLVQHNQAPPPTVPASQAKALYHQANLLWRSSPWRYMWDHQVLAIEINRWDIGTLYAVIMGHLGMERGVIFYLSRSSLVRFRQLVAEDENDDLEEIFLHQECMFTLFESNESLSEHEIWAIRNQGWLPNNLVNNNDTEDDVHPIFGILDPLEGGRPFLYEEEAIPLTVAMQSLNMFIASHKAQLEKGEYGVIKGSYKIKPQTLDQNSELDEPNQELRVTVKTAPDLEAEIQQIAEDEGETVIHQDLLPDNTVVKLLGISWEGVDLWREQKLNYCLLASKAFPRTGDAFSVLLLQTSRPKALELIDQILALGGIRGICFNPAEYMGDRSELGLLVMGNDELHLFGEFSEDDYPPDREMRQRWLRRCEQTEGICGVVIAMGVSGATKGKPSLNHILAYYEVALIEPSELDLGVLKTADIFDLDF